MRCEMVSIRVLPTGRVSAKDAAAMLGRTTKTLANWRVAHRGPRAINVCGRVFYDFEEVASFRDLRPDLAALPAARCCGEPAHSE